MNYQEQSTFLRMCRLAASVDTGGQWTDEKVDAVEAVQSEPRQIIGGLLTILEETEKALNATKAQPVRRRLEDGYWMMQRGDNRVMAEAGAPYMGDTNGVTLRITHGAMGFSTELDADSADALAAWLNQWRRLREKAQEAQP